MVRPAPLVVRVYYRMTEEKQLELARTYPATVYKQLSSRDGIVAMMASLPAGLLEPFRLRVECCGGSVLRDPPYGSPPEDHSKSSSVPATDP